MRKSYQYGRKKESKLQSNFAEKGTESPFLKQAEEHPTSRRKKVPRNGLFR